MQKRMTGQVTGTDNGSGAPWIGASETGSRAVCVSRRQSQICGVGGNTQIIGGWNSMINRGGSMQSGIINLSWKRVN